VIGSVHGSSAWRTDTAALAVPAAAIFVTLIFLHWSLDFHVSQLGLPSGPAPDSLWKPEHYLFGTPLNLARLSLCCSARSAFSPRALASARSCRRYGPVRPLLRPSPF